MKLSTKTDGITFGELYDARHPVVLDRRAIKASSSVAWGQVVKVGTDGAVEPASTSDSAFYGIACETATQSTDVTHFPSRTFTLGDEPAAQEENTPVISLKETPAGQTVPSQSPSVPEPPVAKPVRQSTVSTRSAHAAGKPAADAAEAPAPVQEEPQVHPRSEVKPAAEAIKPAVEAVKPAADEFIGQEESIMDEDDAAPNDSQIEFKVGVSGLTSNNAGESAIIKR